MDTNEIIKQLTEQRDRIDAAIKLLSDSDTTSPKATPPANGKRKPLSAAAKKRMGEAQRKRWAATKKDAKVIPAKVAAEAAPPAKKPGMSVAARKRIAAAQKKRWAAIRAAKDAAKKIPAKEMAKKVPAKKAVAAKKVAPKKAPAKAKKAAGEKAATVSTEAAPA